MSKQAETKLEVGEKTKTITAKVSPETHENIMKALTKHRKYRGTIAYFLEDAVATELAAAGIVPENTKGF